LDNENYKEWKKGGITTQYLFVQPEVTLLKDLTLTTGLGFSTFKLDELKYSIDPSVGLFYSFWSNKRLSLAWSQNNRNPIMHELYSYSSGNPDLLPERAQKSELSLKLPFSNLVYNSFSGVFNFSIYHNDIKNLIERKIKYENIYRAKNSGVEADIALRVVPQWLITASYGRILSEDMSDFSLLRVPEHTVILSNKLTLVRDLTLFHEFKFLSEAVDRDQADRLKTLDPYTLHKLNLSYKYKIANVSVGVENIFDVNYTEKYGFPSPGRTYFFVIEL
jgi:outer membrane receptor protein involved in Fe transport